jgi:hypothetical protein
MQDLAAVRKPSPGENFAVKQQDYAALTSAMQHTLAARKADPVAWAVNAGVGGFKPLQLESPQTLAQSIAARVGPARAIASQYGTAYQLLTKDESTALSSTLESFTAPQKAAALGAMSTALNPADYAKIVGTIKKDSPVTAIAGQIMGAGRAAVLEHSTHWFGADTNLTMDPATVAQTMLAGDALINPTKADKSENGVPKFAMPTDNATSGLRSMWNDVAGDAFRGDGPGQMQAYAAYRAMYAGLAAKAGKGDGVLDSDIATQAAHAVLGDVQDWNDKKVIPPYGMDFDDFTTQVDTAWQKARPSVPGADEQDASAYDLDRIGDGVYVVSNGQAPVRDKDGQPVVLRIAPAVAPDKSPYPFTGKLRVGNTPEQGGPIIVPTPAQMADVR